MRESHEQNRCAVGPRAPRPVSPLMLDGGTAAHLRPVSPSGYSCRFGEVVRYVRRLTREDARAIAARGDGHAWVELPIPPTLQVDHRTSLQAQILAGPGGSPVVSLLVPGSFHIQISDSTNSIRVQFKAPGLWSYETVDWICRCLALATHWVRGEIARTPEELERVGWRFPSIHICRDYVGMSFVPEDSCAVVGVRKTDKVRAVECGGELQTLILGSASSATKVVVYDKTQEIQDRHGGDASTYAATWSAYGREEGERVHRVELRIGKSRASQVVDGATGEVVDLSLPTRLLDDVRRKFLWSYYLGRRRIVDSTTHTELRKCELDSRWKVVVDVGMDDVDLSEVRQLREHQQGAAAVMAEQVACEYVRVLARASVIYQAPIERHFQRHRLGEVLRMHARDCKPLLSEERYANDYRKRVAMVIPEIEKSAPALFAGYAVHVERLWWPDRTPEQVAAA